MSWRDTLRRRRWWIALALTVLVVRISLPAIVRRVLVSQVSKTLQTRVELGDVKLHLLSGGIELKDFAVFGPNDHAAAGSTSGDALSKTPPASGGETSGATAPRTPILAWKNFAVDLSWLPLWHRTIQFSEIRLEAPRIALDRLESGELNVEALVRAATQPAPATGATPGASPSTPTAAAPAAQEATGNSKWRIAVDHLQLSEGRLRFRDLMLKGSEPLDLAIPAIKVDDIALSPDVYGKPTDFHLHVTLDQGSIELAARVELNGNDIALESKLEAQDLPLRRTRLYIPNVGWSDLRGELDTDLTYKLETGKTNELRGTVGLRDLWVSIPDLPDAALSWKSLTVKVDPIDLVGHVAKVTDVDLAGAWVAVRPHGGERLPLLEQKAKPSASAAAEPATGEATPSPSPTAIEAKSAPGEENVAAAAPPTQPHAEPASQAATAAPWQWSVTSVHIADSWLHLIGDDAPMDVSVALDLKNLAGAGETPAKVDLTLGISSSSVHIDGDARVAPPGFGGTLKIAALSLPELISMSGAMARNPIQSATLDADLGIGAGMSGPSARNAVPATDLRVHGDLKLNNPRIASGDTTVDASGLDLRIAELSLPGALGSSGAPAAADRGNFLFRGDLSLANPAVAMSADGPPLFAARSVGVKVSELTLAHLLPPNGAAPPAGNRGDMHFRGDVVLDEPKVALADLGDLHVSAHSIGVDSADVTVAALLGQGGDGAAIPPRSDAGDLHLKCALSLTEPRVALAEGKDFAVAMRSLGLGVEEVNAPGLLAAKSNAPARPMRVALKDLKIDAPVIRVTRTKDGIILPGPKKPAAPVEKAASGGAQPASAAPGIDFSLGSMRIGGGRFDLVDRTLTPTLSAAFTDIRADANDIRFPQIAAKRVRVHVTTPEEGDIDASGDISPSGRDMRLETRDVALTPYSPYAAAFSPYRIASGSLKLTTEVKGQGSSFDVGNKITLQDFDLEGGEGESLFEKQFGIPLSMALALLRDMQGNINLSVPIGVNEQGATVDIWSVAAGALRSALVGALTSPLKLIGSITGGGNTVGSFSPAPITFRLGRAELTSSGEKSLAGMGGFLASRPAMGVELQAVVTEADQRWQREQALRHQWKEQGFFGRLSTLLQRGTRERVQAALEDRGADGKGELSAEDAAQLDKWLEAIPQPTQEQMKALAAARLDKVVSTLRDRNGVDPTRVAPAEPSGEFGEGGPEVKFKLKSMKRLRAAAPS